MTTQRIELIIKFTDNFKTLIGQHYITGSLKFEDAGLRAHNIFRKIHSAPDMKLDSVMSQEAAKYAKVIAAKGSLVHSSSPDGENLALGCTSGKTQMSAEEATKNWYDRSAIFLYIALIHA